MDHLTLPKSPTGSEFCEDEEIELCADSKSKKRPRVELPPNRTAAQEHYSEQHADWLLQTVLPSIASSPSASAIAKATSTASRVSRFSRLLPTSPAFVAGGSLHSTSTHNKQVLLPPSLSATSISPAEIVTSSSTTPSSSCGIARSSPSPTTNSTAASSPATSSFSPSASHVAMNAAATSQARSTDKSVCHSALQSPSGQHVNADKEVTAVKTATEGCKGVLRTLENSSSSSAAAGALVSAAFGRVAAVTGSAPQSAKFAAAAAAAEAAARAAAVGRTEKGLAPDTVVEGLPVHSYSHLRVMKDGACVEVFCLPLLFEQARCKGRLILGRGELADIPTEHPSCSRLHCELRRIKSGEESSTTTTTNLFKSTANAKSQKFTYVLRDLGSGHGTLINGGRVAPGKDNMIEDEDEIQLGFSQRLYLFFSGNDYIRPPPKPPSPIPPAALSQAHKVPQPLLYPLLPSSSHNTRATSGAAAGAVLHSSAVRSSAPRNAANTNPAHVAAQHTVLLSDSAAPNAALCKEAPMESKTGYISRPSPLAIKQQREQSAETWQHMQHIITDKPGHCSVPSGGWGGQQHQYRQDKIVQEGYNNMKGSEGSVSQGMVQHYEKDLQQETFPCCMPLCNEGWSSRDTLRRDSCVASIVCTEACSGAGTHQQLPWQQFPHYFLEGMNEVQQQQTWGLIRLQKQQNRLQQQQQSYEWKGMNATNACASEGWTPHHPAHHVGLSSYSELQQRQQQGNRSERSSPVSHQWMEDAQDEGSEREQWKQQHQHQHLQLGSDRGTTLDQTQQTEGGDAPTRLPKSGAVSAAAPAAEHLCSRQRRQQAVNRLWQRTRETHPLQKLAESEQEQDGVSTHPAVVDNAATKRLRLFKGCAAQIPIGDARLAAAASYLSDADRIRSSNSFLASQSSVGNNNNTNDSSNTGSRRNDESISCSRVFCAHILLSFVRRQHVDEPWKGSTSSSSGRNIMKSGTLLGRGGRPVTRSREDALSSLQSVRDITIEDHSQFGEFAAELSDCPSSKKRGVLGWVTVDSPGGNPLLNSTSDGSKRPQQQVSLRRTATDATLQDVDDVHSLSSSSIACCESKENVEINSEELDWWLPPEVVSAAMRLEVNAVSEVIESENGAHLLLRIQ